MAASSSTWRARARPLARRERAERAGCALPIQAVRIVL